MGRLVIAKIPTTTITIEITIAVTGLRIKVSAIILLFFGKKSILLLVLLH